MHLALTRQLTYYRCKLSVPAQVQTYFQSLISFQCHFYTLDGSRIQTGDLITSSRLFHCNMFFFHLDTLLV